MNATNNTAEEEGGALYIKDSKFEIKNSYFTNNSAKEFGGSISVN